MFTALILNLLDVSLSSGLEQKFPGLDVSTLALGINAGKKGVDDLIHIREVA